MQRKAQEFAYNPDLQDAAISVPLQIGKVLALIWAWAVNILNLPLCAP